MLKLSDRRQSYERNYWNFFNSATELGGIFAAWATFQSDFWPKEVIFRFARALLLHEIGSFIKTIYSYSKLKTIRLMQDSADQALNFCKTSYSKAVGKDTQNLFFSVKINILLSNLYLSGT